MNTIRIGILGAAKIVPRSIIEPSKFVDNICLWGIASRDKAKAEEFSRIYQIPYVFSDYDELLKCDDIDAVYIPLSNDLHATWIINAAIAKKHVLVEKPICLNSAEFDLMLEVSKNTGVQILEAIMVQHHPWQNEVKNMITTGIYGKLQSIKTHSTFRLSSEDNYRLSPEKGGGAFFDLGSYWLQFIQECIGLHPQSFYGKSDFSGPNGIDLTFEAVLEYANGVKSEFLCSFQRPFEANHWLEFEKSKVRIRNFFGPALGTHSMNIDIKEKDLDKTEKIVFSAQNYYVNQLKYFVKLIEGKEHIDYFQYQERVRLMSDIYQLAYLESIKHR